MKEEIKTLIRWGSAGVIVFLLVVGVTISSYHPYELKISTEMDDNTLESVKAASELSKENSIWYKEYVRCEAYLATNNISMME